MFLKRLQKVVFISLNVIAGILVFFAQWVISQHGAVVIVIGGIMLLCVDIYYTTTDHNSYRFSKEVEIIAGIVGILLAIFALLWKVPLLLFPLAFFDFCYKSI